jgi:putative ABC transport system permease protein
LRASKESVDFAQLFIGLSFFIIIAALLLTGLLFIFSLEQRSTENGLLLAVGFPVKSVKRIVYSEAVVIVVIGSVLGIGFGILYNQLILAAIKTIWVDIVGTSAIQLHLKLNSILLGFLGGICMAFFTIWMLLRRQLKKSISTLQRENLGLNMQKDPKRPWLSWVIACTGLVLAIVIILSTSPGRGREATGSFFAAGALLLISGIFFAYTFIYKFNEKVEKSQLSLLTIGIRNNLRRKFRSISLMGLLACGIFIVFTVGANRNSAVQDADKRTSGTGGFALWGECSLPVLYDLNSPKGQEFYGLDPDTCLEADFVQFRVREGDDASCLNLNRITNPQLIGTNPEELNKRNAFTFVEFSPDLNDKNPWLFLDTKISEDVIPGIADQTVIIWGLGKSIGDTIEYIAENGHPFQIKLIGALANSVFQGNIIVSEKFLLEKYPSLSGYKLLLIDAPSARVKPLHDHLSWVLQDLGIDLQSTAFRLDGFNKVENTYLSIFLILGGLGMMLGSVGIGIVVLRNVMERRGELALLKAVGFEHNDIHKLIFYEHLTIFIIGLCIGLFAAIIAVLPALKTPGINVPYLTMILLSLGIILSGLFWTFFATQISTRGELLPALRNE